MQGLKSLFKSRKFVIALVGVALNVTIALTTHNELMLQTLLPSIAALLSSLILSIAWEDTQLISPDVQPSDLDQPQ
jgi:hypothetical protein